MLLKGRNKILSDYKQEDLKDDVKLVNFVNTTMQEHLSNRSDIEYLFNYRNGEQEILHKVKNVRDDINNKLVINHAQMITRTITGYFLGNPIQYIQNGDGSKKEEIDLLNRYVSYEDKSSVDKEIGEIQSICGTAYRIIYTDGMYADEVPFEDRSLHPLNTYVVYENDIAERPLAGITYYEILNDDGMSYATRLYVYTDHGVYSFKSQLGMVTLESKEDFKPYYVGGVPIIEYPNNMWRIGDWELCIGLMDAINKLQSGRLDDIDQIVQSLLIFINAEIDEDSYNNMIEKGIIQLNNTTTGQTEIKSITNTLDQSGMNMFAKELAEMLYALIGIPSRDNRAGGGGDTGQAVELRDGWADLEIVARNKELEFKKSEKKALKIILTILNNSGETNLSLIDIDIEFTRNKNNNLLVKTQGYMNLLATKTLSPSDCLTIVDLVSDVQEYVSRGELFWGEQFANKNAGEVANASTTGDSTETIVTETE